MLGAPSHLLPLFPYPLPQSTTPLPLSWGAELRAGRGLRPPSPHLTLSPVPRFCYVSKFQTPDCLHDNAVTKLIRPIILTEYSLFPNVHQITISGGKFYIFLARTLTKSTAQNAPRHAMSSEKFNNFFVEGHSIALPSPRPFPR